MNRIIYCIGLCLLPLCASAEDYEVIMQPVVCMIQSDEAQSVMTVSPVAVSSNENVIVQCGYIWRIPEDDAQIIIRGDADGDGTVDVNDVTTTINYILAKPVVKFIFEAANVDGDETIDVNDVQGIIDIALGKDK